MLGVCLQVAGQEHKELNKVVNYMDKIRLNGDKTVIEESIDLNKLLPGKFSYHFHYLIIISS